MRQLVVLPDLNGLFDPFRIAQPGLLRGNGAVGSGAEQDQGIDEVRLVRSEAGKLRRPVRIPGGKPFRLMGVDLLPVEQAQDRRRPTEGGISAGSQR